LCTEALIQLCTEALIQAGADKLCTQNAAEADGRREEDRVATRELQVAIPPTQSAGRSWLVWMRIAARRRRLIAGTALAIMVLSCATGLLLPDRYTASAVLLPPQQSGSAGAAMMAQLNSSSAALAAAGGLSIKNPNDQQVSLLKSRTVEDAMVARFHLQAHYRTKYISSARRQWEKLTSADNGLKDGLIRVSVTDSDSQQAAAMANAWVEEYRSFGATLALTEASQRRLFYEQQVKNAHQDLAVAEDAMQKTEQRTGVIDLEGQDRSLIASAAVLRGQLAAKQIQIKAMRQFAAPGNPDLQRAEEEASGMEAQLAAMDADADRTAGDLVAPRGKVTEDGLEYARALREVKYRETILELLTRQYEGARVDEAREGPLIQIVEPAVPPDRPSPYKWWLLLASALCSIPIGLVAAAGAELLSILRCYRLHAGSWLGAIEEVASR